MKQRANTAIGLGGFWAGGLMDPLERPLELRNCFFFKLQLYHDEHGLKFNAIAEVHQMINTSESVMKGVTHGG